MTPSQVVAALGGLLSVTAIVELEEVDEVPYAVVTGASGATTWIALAGDLLLSGGEASEVAAGILAREGWNTFSVEDLLREVCASLGICDAIWQTDRLRSLAPVTVDSLTDAILEAEQLEPVSSQWRPPVRRIVASHFGVFPE